MTMLDTRDFTISHQNFKKQQDHQTLTNIIVSWNSTRLDLFELSLPNENLEFSGKTVNYIVFNYVLSQEPLKIITIASTPISFIKLMLDICLLWKGKCCFVFLG